jgi:hypothetical protein
MTQRVYIVPKVGDGLTPETSFRAKYFEAMQIGTYWRSLDYGLEPYFLVSMDVTPEQHADLVANADVLAFPSNLQATLTNGAVTAIQTELDARNIPVQNLTTSTTYADVLRRIIRVFNFGIRMHVLGWQVFPPGVTLSTTFSQLSAAQKSRLQSAADSYGWDTSGLSGASTMQQMIRTLVVQTMPAFNFAGMDS